MAIPTGWKATLTAFYFVLSIFGTILNTAILYLIVSKPKLRRRISNVYLISVLSATVLSCLTGCSYYLTSLLVELPPVNETTKSKYSSPCRAALFFTYSIAACKILSLTLLSLDRFIAIIWPYFYVRNVTLYRAIASLAFVWIQAFATGLPLPIMEDWVAYIGLYGAACGFSWEKGGYSFTIPMLSIDFLIPAIILIVTNVKVFIVAKRQKTSIRQTIRHSKEDEINRGKLLLASTLAKAITLMDSNASLADENTNGVELKTISYDQLEKEKSNLRYRDRSPKNSDLKNSNGELDVYMTKSNEIFDEHTEHGNHKDILVNDVKEQRYVHLIRKSTEINRRNGYSNHKHTSAKDIKEQRYVEMTELNDHKNDTKDTILTNNPAINKTDEEILEYSHGNIEKRQHRNTNAKSSAGEDGEDLQNSKQGCVNIVVDEEVQENVYVNASIVNMATVSNITDGDAAKCVEEIEVYVDDSVPGGETNNIHDNQNQGNDDKENEGDNDEEAKEGEKTEDNDDGVKGLERSTINPKNKIEEKKFDQRKCNEFVDTTTEKVAGQNLQNTSPPKGMRGLTVERITNGQKSPVQQFFKRNGISNDSLLELGRSNSSLERAEVSSVCSLDVDEFSSLSHRKQLKILSDPSSHFQKSKNIHIRKIQPSLVLSTVLLVFFFLVTWMPFMVSRIVSVAANIKLSEAAVVVTAAITNLDILMNPIVILATRKGLRRDLIKKGRRLVSNKTIRRIFE